MPLQPRAFTAFDHVPQHAMVSSPLMPQVYARPALTDLKGPPGGKAWPYSLEPQHMTVSSLFMAQLYATPALTDLKVPLGGEAWPSQLVPQQASESSSLTAQPCE